MTIADLSVVRRVRSMVDNGEFKAGAALLAEATRAGNVTATAEMAQWAIGGRIIPRNLDLARKLLGVAAASGDIDAGLLHAAFLATGTGGPVDWRDARRRLELLAKQSSFARCQTVLVERMAIGTDGAPLRLPGAQVLHSSPTVRLFQRLLTPEECEYLVTRGSPYLRASVVADPASGRMMPHPVRTSDGAIFGVHLEDLVITALNRRIAHLTGTKVAQGEPLQLLRYRPGTEYKSHLDALNGEPNQRTTTVLVYLNDGYSGGETTFPKLGISVRGAQGDALVFDNVHSDGTPDPQTLHSGLPVRMGTKLLATRWIRAKPFTYPPPPPMLAAFPE